MDGEFEGGERKPNTQGFKQTVGRLRSAKKSHIGHRASLDWRQDSSRVCAVAATEEIFSSVDDLLSVIVKSRTAEALVNDDALRGLKISFDAQTPFSQFYPQEAIVALNPNRPKGDLINLLVRELRRAWQYGRGALVNPMSFEPEEAVLINRAQQADALMVSIKVAWELKLLGEQEAWGFMVGSPMGNVTAAFESHAQKDFRTLNNGEASRAAYDRFFDGVNTKMHDKRLIHHMLLDDKGYMKAPAKARGLGMDIFRRLGEVPHSSNYLSMSGSKRAPNDSCYASIEDRSNANFLWFIKFERSFQEKELEMLKESVRASAEIVDFAKWSMYSRRQTTGA